MFPQGSRPDSSEWVALANHNLEYGNANNQQGTLAALQPHNHHPRLSCLCALETNFFLIPECSTAASNWKALAAEGGSVYSGQLAPTHFLKRVFFFLIWFQFIPLSNMESRLSSLD